MYATEAIFLKKQKIKASQVKIFIIHSMIKFLDGATLCLISTWEDPCVSPVFMDIFHATHLNSFQHDSGNGKAPFIDVQNIWNWISCLGSENRVEGAQLFSVKIFPSSSSPHWIRLNDCSNICYSIMDCSARWFLAHTYKNILVIQNHDGCRLLTGFRVHI